MDWKAYVFIGALIVGALVGTWYLSAHFQHKADLSAFAAAPRDTVVLIDTCWRETVRIKTIQKVVYDTVYSLITPDTPKVDTLYVASADSATFKFKLHLEYAQSLPLDPTGYFRNITVDVRDSIRTITVTNHVVDVQLEWPVAWMVAGAAVFTGLGYYLGSR